MADLMYPNILGQFNQGYDRGQGQLANKLAGQAYSATGDQQRSLLGQLVGVDPRMGTALGGQIQQQQAQQAQTQQAQEVDHAKKINGAAQYVLQAYQSGKPEAVQGAYQAVRPYLAEITGKEPPPQWDDSMLPGLYQTLAATGGMPHQKPTILSNGAQLVDPNTGKVIADNPMDQQPTGELAILRAVQGDPALLHTYQQMHPRPQGGGGGMGHAPVGYRFQPDGSLSAIPGGPADHSASINQGLSSDALTNAAWSDILTGNSGIKGYGKEAVAQRAQIANMKAKIAKEAGVSPQSLATTSGRNKALQSSLTNIQKQTDVMHKSEMGFQNNLDQALALSDKLDRTGSPVLNKWLLGGKAALGDPDVAAFDAAINAASVDYARIMSGQTGAGGTPISTAEEAKALLRKELSNNSLHAVADVLYRDIQGQQQAVESQRKIIMGAMQAFGKQEQQPSQLAQGGGWAIEPVQ